jgi:hypothetical protein
VLIRKPLALALPAVLLAATLGIVGWTASSDRATVEQTKRASDDPGYALSGRVTRAMAAVQRGIISTPVPGGQVVTASWDDAARYRHSRFTGGWLVARGSSAWTRRDEEVCWQRTSAAALGRRPVQVDYMLALLGFAHRQRFATPRPRADGTTALSWRGYWSRGTAIIDSANRITALRASARAGPGHWSAWRYTLAYPSRIEAVNDRPRCRS